MNGLAVVTVGSFAAEQKFMTCGMEGSLERNIHMSTDDISDHVQDIYGIAVSDTTVSRITDKILPLAKEWQQRPLETIYAVVFLDAIHYHAMSEG